MADLMDRIEHYWTDRAQSYSEENIAELNGDKWPEWLGVILEHMPEGKKDEIRILDIGTGPGFFTVLLAREGYHVTAIDYTEEMLSKARENAAKYMDHITLLKMNADTLNFADETFDLIINRNVTWTLQYPEKAYREWLRVLKKNGRIMIFDANWYGHLFDQEKRRAYEEDRKNTQEQGIDDGFVKGNPDEMECIAQNLPMSRQVRPDWDEKIFGEMNVSGIEIDRNIWKRVLNEEEKVSYASMPMFMIVCSK